MTPSHTTGLGNPELAGKRTLFQPPANETKPNQPRVEGRIIKESKKPDPEKEARIINRSPQRVRTTIELTTQALKIIQGFQQDYRLSTGKVLPLWKAVSQAIEYYGKGKESDS
jgi:hypothetical protein